MDERKTDIQGETHISEFDDAILKLFILIVGCSSILYGIYFNDYFVSLLGFMASIMVFLYTREHADEFYKPIPTIEQPLLEILIILVLYFDFIFFLQPLLGISGFMETLFITLVVGFVFPMLFLTKYRGYNKLDIGIRKPTKRSWYTIVVIIALISNPIVQLAISPERILLLFRPNVVLVFVYGIIFLGIATGIVEEFLFRGITQNRITAATGSRVIGLIVTSSLFALLHLFSVQVASTVLLLNIGYSFLHALLTRLPLGVILGIIWNETDSLSPVAAIHATNNIGYLVLLLSAV